jgi:hypothetical protein
MNQTVPPRINYDQKLELFGPKGSEVYYVDKVYFYKCEPFNGKCIHDISVDYFSMTNILPSKSSTIMFYNVEYHDLVSKGYIKFLKKWNSILITPCQINPECRLIKIPSIE